MLKSALFFGLLMATATFGFGQAETPLLLQKPTLSRDHIVFVYAGDLWIVGRDGGEARRLTTGIGIETDPHFSPDGSLIAFTGEYDGNVDVFVMRAAGGTPRRLTFHPSRDSAMGWTSDGQKVLFSSPRHSPFFNSRLFTIPVAGGFPTELPLPTAEEGAFSPDATHLAYVPTLQWQPAWKRYRGGQTKPIWIADLSDSSVTKLPRENSNDFNPLWVGETIYFLSDRQGAVALYAYDLGSKQVRPAVPNNGLDFKSASVGPGAIVIEQFGAILLFDLKSGQTVPVKIHLAGDLAEVRSRFKKVEAKDLRDARLSPTGQRAVFEVRGEIITAPAEKGDVRNLTRTPGIAERDPTWSPDGKWVAYFSEESGEYALHLRDQSGLGDARKISLGQPPSFFYAPTWSPDSKKIAYADKRGILWRLELEKGPPVRIDTNTFGGPLDPPAWSPDSRWLAYTKTLRNRLSAVFVQNIETGIIHPVTDGMSDAWLASFDTSGKYLYFAASTDSGPANSWGDLSAMNRPITRSLYLVVLDKSQASPLAPESDEEKIEEKKDAKPAPEKSASAPSDGKRPAASTEEEKSKQKEKPKKAPKKNKPDQTAKAEKPKDTNAPPVVKFEFENISQRILAVPMPPKNYKGLAAGKTNTLWVLEGPPIDQPSAEPPDLVLHKFDFAKRKSEKFFEGIKEFALSHNREKILYRKGDKWFVAGIDQPPKGEEKNLNLADIRLPIEPRVEWRQMYQEVWRIERDFLYDPGHHGLDLAEASRRYQPYLDGLASREDLNYLFEEMLGELSLGHVFVGGGDLPEPTKIKVGLLGADFAVANGRYRFERIYSGENWNPQLRAPLTEPGVNVTAGEYLLAVDGEEVRPPQNVFAFFQDKAEKLITLRVGPNPDGAGAREVKVKPVDNDGALRNRAWIESNRRKVAELSAGRLAYVYLPDTYKRGYENFNRYFFAQVDKDGFIIDERFNQGGWLADYVVDYLRRPIMNYSMTREGEDLSFPLGASAGPKVMIINEFAGSGGDALPWYFRKAGLGPLVGKRTWGGLVGIGGYPTLLDGGRVMAPHWAIYGTQGEWEVENVGIAPDIEVELDPKAWRAGHDPQLEKAVEIALESLKNNPPPKPKRPAFPNYHQRP